MPQDMVNGDESSYSVGLPVFVEVLSDGSVAFHVDLSEAADADDLTDAQAHLPAAVRAALNAGRYSLDAGGTLTG